MTVATRVVTMVARAVHRGLLHLVPAPVRRAYRAEMTATFEAVLAEAAERGLLAVLRATGREAADLARARRANRPAGIPGTAPHDSAYGAARLGSTPGSTPGAAADWIAAPAWRQAWRSLRRRPAYAGAAVLTLAAGTGIVTAVFTLVDTVIFQPLPYPDADRLVTILESSPTSRDRASLVGPARLEDWRARSRAFTAISGSYAENVTDTSGADPERLDGRRVAPGFFEVFAMPPLAGRWFRPEEEQFNGPGAAVVSESLWTRRFDRSPDAVGRSLRIGGRDYVIVGVMPAAFTSAGTDVWLPAQVPPGLLQVRDARFMSGVGRLAPGVSVEAGTADLRGVQDALGREFPATDAGWSVEVDSLKSARVGNAREGLLLLLGAVAALWAIAVANVAGLTLVQVHRRARELAVRTALGASRARVLGVVVREGVLVAAVGGAAGAALAAWMVALMRSVLTDTPRLNELGFDGRAVFVAGGTAALAALVFGVVPALAGGRAGPRDAIRGPARGVAGGRHRLQKLLVVAQVSMSVLLVGAAALLLQTYSRLAHADTGFDARGVLTFHVAARWDEDRTRVGQLQTRLIGALEDLPAVSAAGMTNFLPATGATLRFPVRIDGVTGPNADGTITVGARMIGGGYLRAIHADLQAGDWCPERSLDPAGPGTAMVNARLAETHADGLNLVGRTLQVVTGGNPRPLTITGIVGDLAEDGHGSEPVPYVYTCDPAGSWPDPEYVVRTSDARVVVPELRRIVREIDPSRAIFGLRPLEDVLAAALAQPRFDAGLLGLFAAAAVALAGIGLYSLFMLVVSERVREIAVRLALGATPGQILGLVLGGAGRLVGAGIATGVALTWAAGEFLRGVLFGVSPLDPAALAAATVILTLVSLAAAAGPALVALRVAPVGALKE